MLVGSQQLWCPVTFTALFVILNGFFALCSACCKNVFPRAFEVVSCVAALVKFARELLCVSVKPTLVCSLSAHGKVCSFACLRRNTPEVPIRWHQEGCLRDFMLMRHRMDLPAVLYYQMVSTRVCVCVGRWVWVWVWVCGCGWVCGWVGVITVLSTELLQLSIPVVEFESKKCFRCIFVNRKLREEVC